MRQSQNLARKPLVSLSRNSKRRKKNKLEIATQTASKPETEADPVKDSKPSTDTDESALYLARKYRDELDSDTESSEPEEGERLLTPEPAPRPQLVEIAPELKSRADMVRPPEPVEVPAPITETVQGPAPELPVPAADLPSAAVEKALPTPTMSEQVVERAAEPGRAESGQALEVPEPAVMPSSSEALPASRNEADIPEAAPLSAPVRTIESAEENMTASDVAPDIELPAEPPREPPELSLHMPEELSPLLAAAPEQPDPPEYDLAAEPSETTERIAAEFSDTVPPAELVEQTIFEDEIVPAGTEAAADIEIFEDKAVAPPLEETLENLEELAPILAQAAAAGTHEADPGEPEAAGPDMANKEEIRNALRAVIELLQTAESEAANASAPPQAIETETATAVPLEIVTDEPADKDAEAGTTPEATSVETAPPEAMTPELTLRLLAFLRAIGYDNPRETLQDFIDRRGLEFLLQKLRAIDDLAGLKSERTLSIAPEEAVEFEPGQLVSVRLIRPAFAV